MRSKTVDVKLRVNCTNAVVIGLHTAELKAFSLKMYPKIMKQTHGLFLNSKKILFPATWRASELSDWFV